MAITKIQRNIEGSPNMVYIQTTDDLATITFPAYISEQSANIQLINNGDFTFLEDDYCLINYADGEGFFKVDLTTSAFVIAPLAAPILQYTTVSITAAEFKAMYATPKLLIPAQGANTIIIMDKVVLVMTYESVDYANGGVPVVEWGSVVNGAGPVAASTSVTAANFFESYSSTFSFVTSETAIPLTSNSNLGIYLSNMTGAFTAGDSDFVAHLWYTVIPTV